MDLLSLNEINCKKREYRARVENSEQNFRIISFLWILFFPIVERKEML